MECLEKLFAGKKKGEKKIFSRQPGFFVLEGMQGGTSGCWRRRLSRLATGPECRVTRYENDFSGIFWRGDVTRKSLVQCYGFFFSFFEEEWRKNIVLHRDVFQQRAREPNASP